MIWKTTDDLYPSLTCFCIYVPPQFTITVRHTSGSEKSVSFDQTSRRAYDISADDRRKFFEAAIPLANQLAKELGLRPVET